MEENNRTKPRSQTGGAYFTPEERRRRDIEAGRLQDTGPKIAFRNRFTHNLDIEGPNGRYGSAILDTDPEGEHRSVRYMPAGNNPKHGVNELCLLYILDPENPRIVCVIENFDNAKVRLVNAASRTAFGKNAPTISVYYGKRQLKLPGGRYVDYRPGISWNATDIIT